jgi:predicted MarR family transcription regulator
MSTERNNKPNAPLLGQEMSESLRPGTEVDGIACHLAGDAQAAALTRLELGVMRIQEAFGSWVVEVHKQARGPQLSYQDISLLHCVRLRGGTPTLGEMLTFQHRHDLSSLQYGFKKLEALGLLKKVRAESKRETAYDITERGIDITARYAALRYQTLVSLCAEIVGMEEAMNDAAAVLERLIGLYDQATQSVLNDYILNRNARAATAESGTAAPRPAPFNRKRK